MSQKRKNEDWTRKINRLRWFHLMAPAVAFIILFHVYTHYVQPGPPAVKPAPVRTASSPEVRAGETVNPRDGAMMVKIPAGSFKMGAAAGDRAASITEKPLHEVYLDEYYIYKYEVTRGQFEKFVDATGYLTTAEKKGRRFNWRTPLEPGNRDHPVTVISHEDAQAYARWAGGSLPTEAQWERAARGNDSRIYPWGNNLDTTRFKNQIPLDSSGKPLPCQGSDDVIFYLPHSRQPEESVIFLDFSKPAGSYPQGASPYGVMDLMGNAFEHCSDRFGLYRVYPGFYNYDPGGDPQSGTFVLKGGGDCDDVDNFRISYRDRVHPDEISDDFGFRLVMTPEQLQSARNGKPSPRVIRQVDLLYNPIDGNVLMLLPAKNGTGGNSPGIYLNRTPLRGSLKEVQKYTRRMGGRLPAKQEQKQAGKLAETTGDTRIKRLVDEGPGGAWDGPTTESKSYDGKGFRVVIPPEKLKPVDINRFRAD